MVLTAPPSRGLRVTTPPEPARLTQGFEVIDWIEACCVFTEGVWRGQPFVLLDWQKRLLLELFTLERDPEWSSLGQPLLFRRGLRRRYREAFLSVPKKNGKGDLAAALALYLLIGDGEISPKGVFAAGSLKQAGLSFRAVQTMILESPVLSQLVGRRNVGDLVIEVPSIPGSRMERVAAEAGTNDGPSLHFSVLDEVHEWPGEQGVKTHGVITNAGAARANSLHISISTLGADEEDDEQVWVQLYRRGQAARRDPAADPRFYFFCVQAPKDADWKSRAVWEQANPSANVTVTWPFYESQWPKGETWCRRYYLNDPPGRAEDAWMPEEAWADRAGAVVLQARLATFVAVRIAHDHRAAAVAIAQLQGEQVALRVRTFEASGLEEYLDTELIEEHIRELCRNYPARVQAPKRFSTNGREYMRSAPGPEVAYHGSFFESSAQRLRAMGVVTTDIPNTQDRISPAAETLMEKVVNQQLIHDGDAELARQVGNVVAVPAPKGWTIQAPTNTRRRIVAAQAAMIAVRRAAEAEPPPSRTMHHGPPR